MDFDTILYELKTDNVLVITLNRPQVLNAFNKQMKKEIREAIESAEADESVRCILLTGTGKSFSTGNDMKEAMSSPPLDLEGQRKRLQREAAFAHLFWDCPKPIIIAVNGHCLGSACEIVLACDIVLAAESATFGVPEVRQSSGAIILTEPWNMGLKQVKEFLFTGNTVDALEAKQMGMVNRVVPDDKLMEESYKLARKIAAVPAYAIKMAKQAVNKTYEIMGFSQALSQNIELMAILHATDTPERVWFRELVKEKGLKEALKARSAKFED